MFLVLQHIACEPPAVYEDELLAWGAELDRVELDQGEPLPDWRPYEAIIAMGGPMGAYQDELPWIGPEKRLIRQAVDQNKPFWGVCLGAQLLAASLGANVRPGPQPEIGVLTVKLTPEATTDPVFSVLPDEFPALQWHSDTYELPHRATRLAYSDAYEQQAFVVNRAYGLQFHLEVPVSLAAEWGDVAAYAQALERQLGDQALPWLIDQVKQREAQTQTLARDLFAAWLEHVVGLDPARAA